MLNVMIRCYLMTMDAAQRAGDRLRRDERGQATAEYVGLVLLMAGVVTFLLTFAGDEIGTAIADVVKAAIGKVKSAVGGG